VVITSAISTCRRKAPAPAELPASIPAARTEKAKPPQIFATARGHASPRSSACETISGTEDCYYRFHVKYGSSAFHLVPFTRSGSDEGPRDGA